MKSRERVSRRKITHGSSWLAPELSFFRFIRHANTFLFVRRWAQPSALCMREEDCTNAARRAREREQASQMSSTSWDWQKKNPASVLAEFFTCLIRAANAPVPLFFVSVFIRVIGGYYFGSDLTCELGELPGYNGVAKFQCLVQGYRLDVVFQRISMTSWLYYQ